MISKYFEKYCTFYLSRYWVNKKKFENILKSKISKDFFHKKITIKEKTQYLEEVAGVVMFYDQRGFFDEEKLIDYKIENLKKRGFSVKKIKIFLKKNFFDDQLIFLKIQELNKDIDIEDKLIDKYLSKSGLSKEIDIKMEREKIQKILKKLLSQGFRYNKIVKYLKENYNLYDLY